MIVGYKSCKSSFKYLISPLKKPIEAPPYIAAIVTNLS